MTAYFAWVLLGALATGVYRMVNFDTGNKSRADVEHGYLLQFIAGVWTGGLAVAIGIPLIGVIGAILL